MRRAFLFALCGSLLTAGCATRGSKSAAKNNAAPSAAAQLDRTVPGPVQVLGRIVAIDLRSLSVVIELAPYAVVPPDYNGRLLISRRDDLQPTARLQASPYLRGRTLGARLQAGRPQINDEVVFAPPAP